MKVFEPFTYIMKDQTPDSLTWAHISKDSLIQMRLATRMNVIPIVGKCICFEMKAFTSNIFYHIIYNI